MSNTHLTSLGWFGEAHPQLFSIVGVLIWSFLFNLNQFCILCIGRLLHWISKFKKWKLLLARVEGISCSPDSLMHLIQYLFIPCIISLKGKQSRQAETALPPEGSCQTPRWCWNPMGYSKSHIKRQSLSSLDARCNHCKSQITKVS